MTTDEALGGIWIAKNRDELIAHMDLVCRDIDMGKTSWGEECQILIELACREQVINNYVKVVH